MTNPSLSVKRFFVLAAIASALVAGPWMFSGPAEHKAVTLAAPDPVAIIAPLPDYVSNGTWWYLDASASQGQIVNYSWNITLNGTSTYLTSEIEIYMFKSLGLYKISLTVTDNVSRTSQAFTAVVSVLDSDQDSLPDWWEIKYFGNLNQTANGDYDHDGYTNLEEYAAGTDPTKPDPPPSLIEAIKGNWVTVVMIAAVVAALVIVLYLLFRKRRIQQERKKIEAALEIERALDHEK